MARGTPRLPPVCHHAVLKVNCRLTGTWHMSVCHSLVTGDVLQLEYHQYGWGASVYHAMQWVHCRAQLHNSVYAIICAVCAPI